jgi:hypothetical protein
MVIFPCAQQWYSHTPPLTEVRSVRLWTPNMLSFVQHEDDVLSILLEFKAATNPKRATAHLGSKQSGDIKTTFRPMRCSSQPCTEVVIVSLRQSRDTRLKKRRNARIQPPGEADLRC